MKLKIDTGIDVRIIVSGIAEFYKPKEIIEQQMCVLINLATRMILMARDKEGKLCFVATVKCMENGGELK